MKEPEKDKVDIFFDVVSCIFVVAVIVLASLAVIIEALTT